MDSAISAQRGWYLLRIEGGKVVDRTQIIGWSIASNGSVWPITVDRVHAGDKGDDDWVIVGSDGRVISPGYTTWNSEEEFLKEEGIEPMLLVKAQSSC